MNASHPMEPDRTARASGMSIHVRAAPDAPFASISSPAEAAAFLEESGDGVKGILLYTPPARTIGRMMQAGSGTDEAITSWLEEANTHLDLVRKWRRVLQVVQARADTSERMALARALAEVSPDAQDPPALPTFETAEEDVSPFFIAIATLAMHSDIPAYTAMSELLARSTGPCDDLLPIAECTRMLREDWQVQREAGERFRKEMSRLMTAQIHDLEGALQQQTTLANTLRKETTDLQSAMQSERDRLDKALKEARTALAARSTERDRLAKTLEETRTALAARSTERDRLSHDIETLRRARKTESTLFKNQVKAECDNRQAMIWQLSQQLEDIQKERDSHKAEAEKRTRELETAQAGLEEAAELKEMLETTRQSLTQQLDDTRKERDSHKAEAEKRTRELETAQAGLEEAEELKEMLETTRQSLAREQELARTLNTQITDLETTFAGTEQQIRDVMGTAGGDLKEILINTRDALTRAQGASASNADMKSVFKNQSRQLEAALQMVEDQRETAQKQLEAVYASISWRVTKPLRSVRRALRG